jgi:hypothetical protein
MAGRSKQDTRTPSAIARTWTTQTIATQGLECAYWIAKSAYEQVVAQIHRQVEKYPDEWGSIIKAEIAGRKEEIPPCPECY